jgi:bla regulator protein blaR1
MNAFIPVAGWTLIHFVWQGAGIALAAAAALGAVRRRSASVRYLVACAGLAAMLAAPVATAGRLWQVGGDAGVVDASARLSGRATETRRSARVQTSAKMSVDNSRQPSENVLIDAAVRPRSILSDVLLRLNPDRLVRAIVFVWVLGVAALLGRMGAGWWFVRRLHRIALDTEPSSWQAAAARLSGRLGLGRGG